MTYINFPNWIPYDYGLETVNVEWSGFSDINILVTMLEYSQYSHTFVYRSEDICIP